MAGTINELARAVTERRAEACTNAYIMATTLGAALVIDPDADPGARAHPCVCATCESNGAADTDAPTAIAANAGHGPREGLARGFRMTKRDGDRTITAHCDVSSHPVGWRLHLWMDGRALTVETIVRCPDRLTSLIEAWTAVLQKTGWTEAARAR